MVKIPWETTDDYIRSGHRKTSDFQPNSLRTITLSEEEGIRAVIGKPKGQDTTEIQSYLFDKAKSWTLAKAKAWFKEHRGQRVREHVSVLMPFQVMQKIADEPLKIRGIATIAGIDKNLNIISEEELHKFAEKLVKAPIYYEHIRAQNAVGKVTRTEYDPETKALFYEADIYDEDTQQKIRKGLINHVSIGANYQRFDVLDGIAFYDLYDAELSLVAVPAVSGTSIQVMQKLHSWPTGDKASPVPSSATESSSMEEKEIKEKFSTFEADLKTIKDDMKTLKQHLKVPEPKTLPEILQSIDKRLTELERGQLRRQEWTREYINDLPDSAFAYIEPGGEKDEQGKTTPRDLRHLPFKNAQGNIDPEHLRNALGRLPQSDLSDAAKAEAQKKLCSAVNSWNNEHADNPIESEVCGTKPAEGGVEQKLGRAVIVPEETEGAKDSLKKLSLREVMEGL